MASVNIRKVESDDPSVFFFRWRDRTNPQPVFLLLDLEDGELAIETAKALNDGEPSRAFNGVLRRWRLGGVPTVDQANRLMEKVTPLAQKMLDGSEVKFRDGEWKGSLLTEEAGDAETQIWQLCEELEAGVIEVEPRKFFKGKRLGIKTETTDDQINEIAQRLGEVHQGEHGEVYVTIGVESYLQDKRDSKR